MHSDEFPANIAEQDVRLVRGLDVYVLHIDAGKASVPGKT